MRTIDMYLVHMLHGVRTGIWLPAIIYRFNFPQYSASTNRMNGPSGNAVSNSSVWHQASGLDKEDKVQQVSTLLYCLGEEADDILTSINMTEENMKKEIFLGTGKIQWLGGI